MLNSNQFISTTDTASTDNATLGRTLEHLIDTASLNRVTMMIASVCGGRASHIRHTTVDEHLALAWEFNAREFKKLSKHAHLTNATIQVRSRASSESSRENSDGGSMDFQNHSG